MKRAWVLRAAMGLMVLAGLGVIGACNQTSVFSSDDAVVDRRLRYYDNDSAHATSEARRRSGEGAFGMPSGAAPQ